MDDSELRCEANSRLLGVNVVFLAEGMSYTGKKDMKAYLDSFFSVFLPYDIEYRGKFGIGAGFSGRFMKKSGASMKKPVYSGKG